jgi:hypothetical protein
MTGTVGLSKEIVRLRLTFSGAADARVNDPRDREETPRRPVQLVEPSAWREQALAEYVSRFGTKLLPVVNNMRHYVVASRDMTVGVLAREASITLA